MKNWLSKWFGRNDRLSSHVTDLHFSQPNPDPHWGAAAVATSEGGTFVLEVDEAIEGGASLWNITVHSQNVYITMRIKGPHQLQAVRDVFATPATEAVLGDHQRIIEHPEHTDLWLLQVFGQGHLVELRINAEQGKELTKLIDDALAELSNDA